MVYGVLKLINFAHGDVFMLGAMMGWYASSVWTGQSKNPGILSALAVTLFAMVVCGVVGLLIERLAYRPLRNSPRLNALITAIGVSLLLQNVGQLRGMFGPDPKQMPALLPDVVLMQIAGVQIRLVDGVVLGTALLLMVVIQW